jgi:hypothetical protein
MLCNLGPKGTVYFPLLKVVCSREMEMLDLVVGLRYGLCIMDIAH